MKTLLSWLLEEEEPGVRFLTMRDLQAAQASPQQLAEARHQAHQVGKIPAILEKMNPDGYWIKPGAGYNTKYQSSVWALMLLAQLGARKEEDERIGVAMAYYRKHAFDRFGKISCSETRPETFDCLQGDMLEALLRLGMEASDLTEQIDWLANSQTAVGIAAANDKQNERRYGIGKSGPDFYCTHNREQPCAWGAIRVLLALGQVPEAEQTENTREARRRAIQYLLQVDPTHPKWPGDRQISPAWHLLTFPLFYRSDILHLVEALAEVGAIGDPRVKPFIDYILSKRNVDGSWKMEFSQPSLAGSFGPVGKPNKWVTLRALRVLQAAGLEI